MSTIKKIFLSAFVTLTFVVYAVNQRSQNNNTQQTTTLTSAPTVPDSSSQTPESSSSLTDTFSNESVTSQPSSTSSTATMGQMQGSQTMPMMNGKYKNGTYTGQVTDAFYGNVQVKVTITNGRISNVQFLDYPHDRSNSVRINSQATPLLAQEAIQVQSSNVDIVSGATATSEAFMQSLASALAQAA